MPSRSLTSGLFLLPLVALAGLAPLARAQSIPTCQAGGTAPTLHVEGQAEQVGTVTLFCTGGTVNTVVNANLFVNLNANITNKLDASGAPIGVGVTANGGISIGAISLYSPTTIAIGNVQFPVTGIPVTISITGIRASMPSLPAGANALVTGSVVSLGGVQVSSGGAVVVGTTSASLSGSLVNNGIPCAGSVAPATLDFPGLQAAGTTSSSLRVTEVFGNDFLPKSTGADSGVRILVKISGYGSSTVYVPDALVGSAGSAATSAGAYGASFNGGTYTPGSNQLLLIRVSGADATGAGGQPVFGTPGSATGFTSVSKVTLTNGAGVVVYEVVDSNPAAIETVQVPVFVSVPANTCSTSGQATLSTQLAPVSNVTVPTSTDPVPRFAVSTSTADCTYFADCNAAYFPTLTVDTPSITVSSSSLGSIRTVNVLANNSAGGLINYTVSVSYPTGQTNTGWLTATPTSGSNATVISIQASPLALPPGQYLANVTVNAGSAGTVVIPVTFNVGPVGVLIQSLVNSASQTAGPVAPGSYATIYGVNLSGKNVQVVFNGYPATIVYDSAGQINLLVPTALANITTAGVYATIDGQVSNTFTASLTSNAPAIFGSLNQDNSVNLAGQPASRGDIIQIFLTGLATPIAGPLTVTLATQVGLVPVYAGIAPSIPGLEQVNVQIPVGLTVSGNIAALSVCIPGTGTQPICSPAVNLYLR